jgi:hypothetical protein
MVESGGSYGASFEFTTIYKQEAPMEQKINNKCVPDSDLSMGIRYVH